MDKEIIFPRQYTKCKSEFLYKDNNKEVLSCPPRRSEKGTPRAAASYICTDFDLLVSSVEQTLLFTSRELSWLGSRPEDTTLLIIGSYFSLGSLSTGFGSSITILGALFLLRLYTVSFFSPHFLFCLCSSA